MKHLIVPALLVVATLGLLVSASQADDTEERQAPNPVVVMKTTAGDIEIELFPDGAPETVKNFIALAEGTKEWTNSSTGEKTKTPFFDGLAFHRCIKDFMIQGGCPLGNGRGDPGFMFKDEINGKGLGLDKQKLFTNGQPHSWILGLLDQRNQQRAQAQFQQMVVGPLLEKMGITTQEQVTERQAEVQKKMQELTMLEVYENLGYEYDDSLVAYHPKRGVIAMANSGPNTNGSQFFINVVDTPHLTGKHTVFGKVVAGMPVVDKIVATPVGSGAKPLTPVKIISVRLKK